MSIPTCDDTRKLHSQYCALTGLEVPYTMQLHYAYEAFIVAGFGEPDLACVIRYLKARIRKGKNPKESLLPRNLIQRTDHFGENLAIARATARNERTESPRERVLRQSGRPVERGTPAKAVGDIVAAAKALEDLRKWRQANDL